MSNSESSLSSTVLHDSQESDEGLLPAVGIGSVAVVHDPIPVPNRGIAINPQNIREQIQMVLFDLFKYVVTNRQVIFRTVDKQQAAIANAKHTEVHGPL